MQRVPQKLFDDAESWKRSAKQKLDKFEENMEKTNFINYDLLEIKNANSGPDIINYGENLVSELDKHRDISMARVENQIEQLSLTFDQNIVGMLPKVVHCGRVDGIDIDESEMANLEEMLKEVCANEMKKGVNLGDSVNDPLAMTNRSMQSDANPMTRRSLALLEGDEDDLLSQSPVFNNVQQPAHVRSRSEMVSAQLAQAQSQYETVSVLQSVSPRTSFNANREYGTSQNGGADDPLEEQLLNEINDYLQGIVEDNSPMIEMSDAPIRSQGASCVATAIGLCKNLVEVRLANCDIRDAGAIKLFEELADSKSVEQIDLSGNPITEKCFDAIETCLLKNKRLTQVSMHGTNVKSNFAWAKFKKFGRIVQH